MRKKNCRHVSPSFALISVLALVSLAALTATAFLASARLERQATRSLSQTVQLDMALAAGEKCAEQTMGDGIQASGSPNFVTTLYRGPGANDWTNEGGYLFIGQPNSSKIKWTYYAGFSPATLTNLDSNSVESFIRWTNSQQGAYTNELQAFMNVATSGFSTNPAVTATSKICTILPLLGGRISPPVGWVYLYQDKRVSGTPKTTNIPVARVAWFMEDLSGMIDAERMGGLTTRNTGTNPEEISLTNMTRLSGGKVLQNVSTMTNNRKLFFTPGLLANSNISGLTNTNDLRYFATGLREWRPTNNTNGSVSWIPAGIFSYQSNGTPVGYKLSGYLKMDLNRIVAQNNPSYIASFIQTNLPNFTNRAGGMSGAKYIYALAANMIDYADTNSSPTIFADSVNTHVGYDNYPLPVVFSDQIAWTQDASNPSNSIITVITYIQFWNCSTLASPEITYTLQNNFQDTYLKSNGVTSNIRLFSNKLSNSLSIPALSPNQIIILTTTNTTTVGTNAGYPGGLMIGKVLGINNNNSQAYATFTDLFELKLTDGTIISQHKGPYTRIGQKITNGSWDFEGTTLTMSRDKTTPAPIGDPRMLRFISNSTTIPLEYRSSSSGNLKWGGYANFKDHPTAAAPWNGHPDNWPDGRKGAPASLTGTGQTGGAGGSIPVAVGTPLTLPGAAPAILTTNGKFLSTLELGNIFDPIQWTPPANFTDNSMYFNCDIDATWSTNSAFLYGGGSTLRIGRPEHLRFAFTNLGTAPASQPIPNTGQSAAALLDLFCISNPSTATNYGIYRTGGKINLNTAPAPVLAALAGGINLNKDTNKAGSEVNATMISAFTNGVMRFRSIYPFLTPSHLAFISSNYGTTNGWTNNWASNAVFSTAGSGGLNGVTSLNDEGREEWFSKVYELASVSSVNYRFYIAAQLVDINSNAVGAVARKYCQYAGRPDTTTSNSVATNYGVDIFSWIRTTGQKKVFESPY